MAEGKNKKKKFQKIEDEFWDKKFLIGEVPKKDLEVIRIFQVVKGKSVLRLFQNYYIDKKERDAFKSTNDEDARFKMFKPGKGWTCPIDLIDEIMMIATEELGDDYK